MLVFIDESGIHKQVDHSTFAVAYVKIDNYEKIEKKIIATEKKLGINYFHWAETVWKVKEEFMNEILELDFQAKIAVVNNPINPTKQLEKVLLHTIVENDISNIFIDGKKPKWFGNKIKKVLRDKGVSVGKLRTVRSSQFAGARLADMIAGLTRTYYDKKNLNRIEKYYKKLQKKLIVTIE